MAVALIRDLYDYHRWANRRLFDLAAGLGDAVTRDMGPQWSFPTLKGMFAHVYGADNVWLTRWKGSSPGRLLGDGDFTTMADLRARWDALEAEQRAFVDALSEADLSRPVVYKNTGGTEFQVVRGEDWTADLTTGICQHRTSAMPLGCFEGLGIRVSRSLGR